MNSNECLARTCFKLTACFILLNILSMTGCATYGDLKESHEGTQASVESLKRDMKKQDQDLRKEMKILSRKVEAQENQAQEFTKRYETILRENAELRASILGVTGTIKGFLSAEKKHYEEGLRWVDHAEKTVGEGTAELSGDSPPPPSSPSDSPPPESQTAVVVAPPVTEEAVTNSEPTPIPTIEVLEVEIDPPEVVRDSEMKVTVKYDLQTNPESPKLTYREQVELLKGTLTIKTLKDSVERAPGTFAFSQTIEVPAQAVPGVYTIKALVSSGSVQDSKIKTFTVK